MIRFSTAWMYRPIAYPADEPESDGTFSWDHTDVVVVHAKAGGSTGTGWTYAARATAELISQILRDAVIGRSATAIEAAWDEMYRRLRNAGAGGTGSMAVAAVDIALWDLKATLLGVPLAQLFGPAQGSRNLWQWRLHELHREAPVRAALELGLGGHSAC